jgi:hypothetical protein
MKIMPRGKEETYSLPLPIYSSIHIADAINREGKEFDILVGLDKKYVEKLRAFAADEKDTDLQNFTSDRQRFVEGTYEYWYEKSRSLFALIHKQDDDLAAVVWFGPKPLGAKSPKFGGPSEEKNGGEREVQSEWHTISFRCYPRYRGQGMMKVFTQFAMEQYKKHFPHVKFWGGMDDRNGASAKLFQDLGFHVNVEHSDLPEHWLIMVSM